LPEVLRGAEVGGATLVAPAPVFDPATAAAVAAERQAADAAGYARGLAEGRAAAAEGIARLAASMDAALASLQGELAAERETALATDLTLVQAVVEAVLGSAPPTAALTLLDRVREAAAMLDDPRLEVRVHPGDHTVLADASLDPRIDLVADPAVAAGDATVAGTWGQADLRRTALRESALAQLTATHHEVAP
jgi:flagellar biosynthesis/type III secretory pathway protein FliH